MAKKDKFSNKMIILKNLQEEEVLPLRIEDFIEDKKEDGELYTDLKNIIISDTREQKGWNFQPNDIIESVEKIGLPTGDYSIKGLETDFVIERKGSTGEFAQNITTERFENEMKRLESFRWPFLICEFDLDDLLDFPVNSGIPSKLWNKVKLRGKFLVSAFLRYQVIYKTKFILAGSNGMQIAESLFKMVARHGK